TQVAGVMQHVLIHLTGLAARSSASRTTTPRGDRARARADVPGERRARLSLHPSQVSPPLSSRFRAFRRRYRPGSRGGAAAPRHPAARPSLQAGCPSYDPAPRPPTLPPAAAVRSPAVRRAAPLPPAGGTALARGGAAAGLLPGG